MSAIATSGLGVATHVARIAARVGVSGSTAGGAAAATGVVAEAGLSGGAGNSLGQVIGMAQHALAGEEIRDFDTGQALTATGIAMVGATVPAAMATELGTGAASAGVQTYGVSVGVATEGAVTQVVNRTADVYERE